MKKSDNTAARSSDPAEFYQREASQYDRKRWSTDMGRYLHSVHKEIISQLSPGWAGKRVLEMGVGTGRFTTMLAAEGAEVVGFDISASMVRIAGDKLKQEKLEGNSDLLVADATKLPFRDCSFDGALCINVFSHIPNYRASLREVARVLKPGGFIITNYPNLLSYYFAYGLLVNLSKKSLRAGVFTHWYNLPTLKADYRESGLCMEQVLGQVHFPPSIGIGPLAAAVRWLDRTSRSSPLRYLAPTLFLRARKPQG